MNPTRRRRLIIVLLVLAAAAGAIRRRGNRPPPASLARSIDSLRDAGATPNVGDVEPRVGGWLALDLLGAARPAATG